MSRLLPRHMMLIERIDAEHAAAYPARDTHAVSDGHVNMGALSFHHGQPGERGGGFGAAHRTDEAGPCFRTCTRCTPTGS